MRNYMGNYDPFSYQPMMRSYYMGVQFPQTIQRLQRDNPEFANHIGAVYQFSNWLQQKLPDVYSQILANAPNLLNAGDVVLSGKMGSTAVNRPGMSGLGQMDFETGIPNEPASSGSSGSLTAQVTEWGKMIADFGKTYLTYDAQKKLLNANIKRAEQGLPPLDASAYGVGVNVGLTPQTQNLVIMALIGFGLFAAFKAVRK